MILQDHFIGNVKSVNGQGEGFGQLNWTAGYQTSPGVVEPDNSVSGTDHPGCYRIDSPEGNGYQWLALGSRDNQAGQVQPQAFKWCEYEVRTAFPAGGTGSVITGFLGLPWTELSIELIPSTYGNNNWHLFSATLPNITNPDTGIDATSGWFRMRFEMDPGEVRAFIGGTLVGTVTGPSLPYNRPITPLIMAGSGGARRSVWVDRWSAELR